MSEGVGVCLSHQAGPGHEDTRDDEPISAVSHLPSKKDKELLSRKLVHSNRA